jgi:hypothetical protein
MLNTSPFYYKLLRKYVTIFGSLFNNITLVRYNKADDTEFQRIKIPIIYAPKEKYVTRWESDPDLLRDTQTVLPRLSFEITGVTYDANRKQNSLLRVAKGDTASRTTSAYMGVPYDINFQLNLYARNIDDAAQIVEQILPYFNPDYTVTINPIPELGFLKDIPIIQNSVVQNVQYETNYDTVRYVYWTFNYTLKGYFFGPYTKPKIIRKAIANIFNDPTLTLGYTVKINTGTGNGTFKITDTIYQGDNYQTATAFGTVIEWRPDNDKLIISGVQGNFKVNTTIRASSTNAVYNIASFDSSPIKLTQITVEPDPINAEPESDYGFTTTITEWPYTET